MPIELAILINPCLNPADPGARLLLGDCVVDAGEGDLRAYCGDDEDEAGVGGWEKESATERTEREAWMEEAE